GLTRRSRHVNLFTSTCDSVHEEAAMGGFEVVDPGYRALYERASAVLGADARVTAVGVGGSIGSGTADPWSDLDLRVAVDPAGHDAFVAEWPRWLADITPTVFARTPLAPWIVNAVTVD